jgi:Ser/Thr protein kinase RdoA (MazF antagonist)
MDITRAYRDYFHLHNGAFTRIDHNDTMVAIVYRITEPNKDPLILKICTRTKDYVREEFFLKFLKDTVAVPRIIQMAPPQENLKGAILMECLPGTLLDTNELTESLSFEIGFQLASIHSHRLKGYGDTPQSISCLDPRPYFSQKFEEHFNECVHHLPQPLLTSVRRFYESHLDLLVLTDGPCAVHRDFRPGNLIVLNGKLQGIIDWASASSGFAEEDFCSIEHEGWLANQQNKRSFLAGYASKRPTPDYQSTSLLLRLNKALGIIGFAMKQSSWTEAITKIYRFNLQFLETFFL